MYGLVLSLRQACDSGSTFIAMNAGAVRTGSLNKFLGTQLQRSDLASLGGISQFETDFMTAKLKTEQNVTPSWNHRH